ncbi:hypothetical protein PFISCL1PPCAC_2759, partial [Pristionchus fissidentatus]
TFVMDTAITTFEAPTVPEIHGDMGIVVSAIPKSSYTNQVLEFTVDISSIPLEDSVFVSCTDAEGENFTGRWVDVGERTYRVSFCPNRKGTATINLHYNNVRLDFSASVEIIADEERSDTRDPSALQYSRCCPLCLDEYPRRRAAY